MTQVRVPEYSGNAVHDVNGSPIRVFPLMEANSCNVLAYKERLYGVAYNI